MNITLKTKLVLASVVAITVTAVSFGFVSYSGMKQEAWRAIESESTNTTQAHAMGIGNWMLGKRLAIEGLKDSIENDPSLDIVSHLKQTYKSGGFGLSYYGNVKGEMFRQDRRSIKRGTIREPGDGINKHLPPMTSLPPSLMSAIR